MARREAPAPIDARQESPSSWRRAFYERLGAITVVAASLVGGTYMLGNELIDRSNETVADRINEAAKEADARIEIVGSGFDEAKNRFDAAKEQCEVIDTLGPQISTIAEALGLTTTTTTSTVPGTSLGE